MKGDGSIYRRPATRHWWVEYHVGGVRHRESSGTDSKQEARRFLRKRQHDAAEGKQPWVSARLTVLDLIKLVEDDYVVNARKMDLRGPVKHLLAGFLGLTLSEITSSRITQYQRWRLEAGAAAATVNIELAILRRGFNLALKAGKLSVAPHVQSLQLRNTRKGFFELAEFNAIHSHLPSELAVVMETAYETGWRIGELLSRRKSHVDLETGFLRLDPGETKNGDGRMFALTPNLRTLLKSQLAVTKAVEVETRRVIPWLFHRNGRRILSYRKAWAAATKAAGLEGRLVHDLRRTAVRNLERAGVSRSTAMKMTGHRTESVYRRYAIVNEDDLREGSEKLSRLR